MRSPLAFSFVLAGIDIAAPARAVDSCGKLVHERRTNGPKAFEGAWSVRDDEVFEDGSRKACSR